MHIAHRLSQWAGCININRRSRVLILNARSGSGAVNAGVMCRILHSRIIYVPCSPCCVSEVARCSQACRAWAPACKNCNPQPP
eukprot:scaffold15507_cov82-Isochrysis_galbana.AAC.1